MKKLAIGSVMQIVLFVGISPLAAGDKSETRNSWETRQANSMKKFVIEDCRTMYDENVCKCYLEHLMTKITADEYEGALNPKNKELVNKMDDINKTLKESCVMKKTLPK